MFTFCFLFKKKHATPKKELPPPLGARKILRKHGKIRTQKNRVYQIGVLKHSFQPLFKKTALNDSLGVPAVHGKSPLSGPPIALMDTMGVPMRPLKGVN